MLLGFFIRGEKLGVEHVVEALLVPLGWYVNLVNYGGYYFGDGEWAISACGQFLRRVCECEVCSFEPYFVSSCEWSEAFV